MGAVVSSNKLFRTTDDEATGQTDVRTTIERLGQDVRNARSIDPGATASQLVLWIDGNSDYKTADEVVTWRLVASTEGHFDVTRLRTARSRGPPGWSSASWPSATASTARRPALATPLTAQASAVRVVTSDIHYDAAAGRAGAGTRTSPSD